MIKNKKSGFSLAELLLAMLIIGIVASLTITNLILNTQNAQHKTALKKVMSNLNGAGSKLKNDYGGYFMDAFKMPGGGCYWTDESVRDPFLMYMDSVKTCDRGTVAGECLPNNIKDINGVPRTYFNHFGIDQCAGAILKDGTSLCFTFETNCSVGENWGFGRFLGSILADVNSFKGPNTLGRDIFFFHIMTNGTIKPWGINGDTLYCNSTSGLGCAIKVMLNQNY